MVEPPREASHGDLATNAAMALAKDAGLKPRDLAEKIAAELRKLPEVTKTEIAGPGFINLTLDPAVWREALADIDPRRARITAAARIGAGQKVNVEYVSANPTGPMHVGHCRGAVFGDALANLLAFAGFAVTREYYINDAGAQVDVLARSALPALPRGARREHRRDPRGALSGRLSQAGRRGAGEANTATSSRPCPRPNGCRWCAPRRSP